MSAPDRELLTLLDKAFAVHAGGDQHIDPADLQRALGIRSEFLAKRVLQCLDRDGNGVLTRDEFLAGVRTLVFGTDRDKLSFAFRLHDENGDGYIDRKELEGMIAISLAEAQLNQQGNQAAALTNAVFARADVNKDGRISFEELETIVRSRPALLEKMTHSEAIWIAPNEDLLDYIDEKKRRRAPSAGYTEGGVAPVVIVSLWVVAQAAVFAWAFFRGDASPHPDLFLRGGKAFARAFELDAALILIPMMRRLVSYIRTTWLRHVLAIDDAVDFHRMVGQTMFFLSLAHGATVIVGYALGHAKNSIWQVFFGVRGATGAALVLVFLVMWLGALAFIRRSHRFEIFTKTHLLYIVFFPLALVHAPSAALWVGVPVLGFAIEQAVRILRRAAPSPVFSSRAHRSGVTRLEIVRPKGFEFGAGDYAFLRIPKLASEWHPFTISSAPERKNLTFHVRALGNWTGALRDLATRTPDGPGLVANIDGPYGSPSRHIFQSRFAVLIGAGIGVTPFASVLESIVLRSRDASATPLKLEKAYFFWLNRDQYSFEWFRTLLRELERTDEHKRLDIHLCMTGAKAGATSLGLELARDIMHTAGQEDIVTGLRAHTHFGSPDWSALLGDVAKAHPNERVDVFYCGPPGLARKIQRAAAHLGMSFREERF